MTAIPCRRPELHIEGECERCELDRVREALEEVTRIVMQESESHRFGRRGYDATLDHLHDVAATCRKALLPVGNGITPEAWLA